MKHCGGSSFDRISDLPSNLVEIILMFLPLQDMVRTSILSRKWRFEWAKVPELVFNNSLASKLQKNHRDIVKQIYKILLLHHGPILKFTLDMSKLRSIFYIDEIIIFLSRNGIQELTLCLRDTRNDCCPKLPSYIFSCQQLRHLSLKYLEFIPPPTFKGFSMLISLELRKVHLAPDVTISSCPLLEILTIESATVIDCFSLDAPNLKFLCFEAKIKKISFINTPNLAILSFTAEDDSFVEESAFDFIKHFGSLPLIENLHMNFLFLKLLAVRDVPEKLPIMLNYLRSLELCGISFSEMEELSSALCLLRSSPNLQKLKFNVEEEPTDDVEPVLEYLKMQFFSNLSFNKLTQVEINIGADLEYSKLRPELEFIKLLLAISPKLETIHFNPFSTKIDKSGYMMLLELSRFQRASPKAEIIFPHPAEA